MEKILQVKDLELSFHTFGGEVKAIRGVNFDLYKGETLAIVGESGSGKSVTTKSIMRLLPEATSEFKNGEILFGGRDLTKLSDKEMQKIRGKDISMIFQDPMTSLNPTMPIGRQITEPILKHQKIGKDEAKKVAIDLLRLVGMPKPELRMKQYPHQFSGGQRQRIVIAIALACNPQILIADEPTTALDVTIQAQILELMKDLQKQLGMELAEGQKQAFFGAFKHKVLVITGGPGVGKTTLVKHFNGLLQPTAGKVTVCGKDTAEHSIFEIGKEIGYVFQNPDHQIFAETVFDEVAFSPKIRGCPEAELAVRVREALEAVDLAGYEEKDPFSLSKGERQRVAVASVLSARPGIIILDEPTTGLDYAEQRKMMELVRKLNESGQTVIMITHTMWVVAEYAHRVVVVKDGRVLLDGTVRDVFAREEELKASHLRTPHIVSMSNLLGRTLLSVEEMKYCTGGVS